MKKQTEQVSNALKVIADAAAEAIKTMAQESKNARDVVLANAKSTAEMLGANTSGDHDLLIRLEENVNINFGQIKKSIQDLTDGTANRLSALEVSTAKNTNDITKIFTWGGAGVLGLSILQFVIGKYF